MNTLLPLKFPPFSGVLLRVRGLSFLLNSAGSKPAPLCYGRRRSPAFPTPSWCSPALGGASATIHTALLVATTRTAFCSLAIQSFLWVFLGLNCLYFEFAGRRVIFIVSTVKREVTLTQRWRGSNWLVNFGRAIEASSFSLARDKNNRRLCSSGKQCFLCVCSMD